MQSLPGSQRGGGCGRKDSASLSSTFWSLPPRWEQMPTSLPAHRTLICVPLWSLPFDLHKCRFRRGPLTGGQVLLRVAGCQGFEWNVVSESYSSPSLSYRVPDQGRVFTGDHSQRGNHTISLVVWQAPTYSKGRPSLEKSALENMSQDRRPKFGFLFCVYWI